MKRFRIPLLLLLAASLWSCVHEFPVSENGDPSRDFSLQLRFTDDLPVRKAPATKAGDAAEPRYTIQLFRYRTGSEVETEPSYTYSFTRKGSGSLDTTLYFPIAVDRYRVAGWVDWPGETPAFDVSRLARVSLATGYPAGERARDAFAFTADYDVSGKVVAGDTYNPTVQVTRPVGQLRFVVSDGAGFLARTGQEASALTATLRYTSSIPDSYELQTGQVGGSRSGVSLSATPQLDASGALVLLSDFVFATDEGSSVTVDFSVKTASGQEVLQYTGTVPLRRTRATTVNLGQSGAFTKMKNINEIMDGVQGILVYDPLMLAMGAEKGNRREAVPVSVSRNTVTDPAPAVQVFTLEASGSSAWALAVPGGYLATIGDGLGVIPEKKDNALWYIVSSEKGVMLMAVGAENPLLGYDEAEGMFRSFAATDIHLGLFLYLREMKPVDKILNKREPGCYLSGNTREYVAGRDQYAVLHDGDGFTFALLNPRANEQFVVSGMKDNIWIGDRVRVSLNWRRGSTNKLSSNLDLTVVQVQDNTVWLADEKNGNGLVIKK